MCYIIQNNGYNTLFVSMLNIFTFDAVSVRQSVTGGTLLTFLLITRDNVAFTKKIVLIFKITFVITIFTEKSYSYI